MRGFVVADTLIGVFLAILNVTDEDKCASNHAAGIYVPNEGLNQRFVRKWLMSVFSHPDRVCLKRNPIPP